MASVEEASAGMAAIVEDGFKYFNNELTAFRAAPPGDASKTAAFSQRVNQYVMLFWGYEHVTAGLKLGDAAQLARVTLIRGIVEDTLKQVQALQSQQYHAAAPQPAAIDPRYVALSTYNANNEFMLKQKQAFAYQNRMWQLTNGGIPFIQAQLIARQETGYTG